MTRFLRGFRTRRSAAVLVVLGLAMALVSVAACGGTAATATPEPRSQPGAAGTGQTSEGFVPGAVVPGLTDSRLSPAGAGLPVPLPAIQYGGSQQVGIWVTAQGVVEVTPDLAILSAGVEAKAPTVQEARSQAAQAMDQIVGTLRARGILDADIQTRFFNISPEEMWNDRTREVELVGYRVSNQVSVRIRDIDSVGLIVDEVAAAGGDLVRVQGINFSVEDTALLEVQARERAVQALMEKAQQFADLTGVTLGRPVFLSESGGAAPIVQNAMAARALSFDNEAATPIMAGELNVSITIQGVFSIAE